MKSVATATGTPASMNFLAGIGFWPRYKEARGKTHRHHAGPSHCGDSGIGGELEVIRRRRPDFRGQLRAATGGELIGMELGTKTRFDPGRENTPSLVDAEGGRLDEDIAEPRQALRSDLRNKLFDQERQIPGSIVAPFGGNGMSAQERRYQPYGCCSAEGSIGSEQLELVVAIQSISALAFDRRHPEGQHLAQKSGGTLGQRLLARFAGQPDGACDPAAGARDIEIAASTDPLLELVGSPLRRRRDGCDSPPVRE